MGTRTGGRTALTIGIDVGGTSIRAAVVDADGQVLDSALAPTPRSAQALEDGLDRAVRELCARHGSDRAQAGEHHGEGTGEADERGDHARADRVRESRIARDRGLRLFGSRRFGLEGS
ncbi:ROK family protein [Rhodococcus maanshanensis]|uniref:ROK family protein n=1 Tax=Rhodococcus maanshanensis TaxID=183556 RepID=UPI0009FA0155|nr:ROK family protein [Rhodococcus maanshanensis]